MLVTHAVQVDVILDLIDTLGNVCLHSCLRGSNTYAVLIQDVSPVHIVDVVTAFRDEELSVDTICLC